MSNVYHRILDHQLFSPPADWLCIHTIDMHTGGEPLRVIVGGFPQLQGNSVLEYRRDMSNRFDELRRALMHEPRGHADMYGCILLPPNDNEADFGILFMHNEGYSTMCGHAIIAVSRLAVDMGWAEKEEPYTHLKIDAPCGRIDAYVEVGNSVIKSVYFHGVPSFVVALDQHITIESLGEIRYDIAYGGAFYAYVDAAQLGLSLMPENYSLLIKTGMEIKKAVMQKDHEIMKHPFEADLSFLYGTIFIGKPLSQKVDSRNVCIFADGELDRSPTGSGVSGRMAIHYARNEISVGDSMLIESITGSVFGGAVERVTSYGGLRAVIPRVEGTAYVTGQHSFLIDPSDPFRHGFFLR